jgi:hypothetical protein
MKMISYVKGLQEKIEKITHPQVSDIFISYPDLEKFLFKYAMLGFV